VFYGERISVKRLFEELEKDRLLYETSGGGVTLSGGEPAFQPEFTSNLLKALRDGGYHTALDTSGYTKWGILKKMVEDADLVLYDLKHMDSRRHEEETGVPNWRVLSNLKRIAALGKELIVRVPVVPGFNDTHDNFGEMSRFLEDLGVKVVELLPYHNLGVPKYRALGRKYALEGLESPEPGHLKSLGEALEERGIEVVIEGME
jgi:pyruvate formate lyase activating enzyme